MKTTSFILLCLLLTSNLPAQKQGKCLVLILVEIIKQMKKLFNPKMSIRDTNMKERKNFLMDTNRKSC
ncbi:MAG: hypothetical protein LBG80_10520 [Bacteroidales bacterium]|jgi:hypothetical protein|nr:hypothetical protein [Bacteroidales bacterium]